MGYESNIIRAASRQLEEKRNRLQAEFLQRQQEIYARLPRTAVIDRQLQATISGTLAAAFRSGTDPTQAVAAYREQNLALQREREQLLVQHGYAADALVQQPDCGHCNDTGWRGAAMCSCLKQLCARQQISQLSSMLDLKGQSFESFRLDAYSNVPEADRMGLSARDNMQMVFMVCNSYAREFPNFHFKNLFLTGAPGLGKTFLSASIAGVVAERGFSVVYDTAVHVFAQFEARKFEKDPDAEESTQRYLNCDLLILDDLGSEMRTAFTHSALYEILNARLVGDKCTVISSNLSHEQIRQQYTPQIYSRIAGEFRPLAFFGQDIRQQRRDQI